MWSIEGLDDDVANLSHQDGRPPKVALLSEDSENPSPQQVPECLRNVSEVSRSQGVRPTMFVQLALGNRKGCKGKKKERKP